LIDALVYVFLSYSLIESDLTIATTYSCLVSANLALVIASSFTVVSIVLLIFLNILTRISNACLLKDYSY